MPKAYSIVGTNFVEGGEAFVKTLQPGAAALLVREPANEYDANAVAVWVGDRKVGYVPKKQNAGLAQFIDQTGNEHIVTTPIGMALDETSHETNIVKAIEAKFTRSPNSGFPMVEV